MATIVSENEAVEAEMDVKRFYIPGVIIKDNCPNCGVEHIRDLGEHYLLYPKLNAIEDFGFYCDSCSHEWKIQVRLTVKLEIVQ